MTRIDQGLEKSRISVLFIDAKTRGLCSSPQLSLKNNSDDYGPVMLVIRYLFCC